ncbi:DNA ligase D [Dyella monticola]|uniref:DNA ligase (ATP) n=1 Tax=Dyella monticola TaxID=1927958 RepID=A0A370WXR6_9GAMM|nr:DNA ligase D [Dyella monticola]RDS80775.1 DNA ligase D [Dyella monticola]
MSLREYQRKRNFQSSKEPRPDTAVPEGARALFVVQLHHASRRHFDFRLQMGNALKSWAVPKGPSYNPKIKRLAVEVEDHPMAYADFEGEIEEGYGKGHVDQFDRGVWATDGDPLAQLKKGHLRFELFGKRLKGSWHLVRSSRKERQPSWFLIKADDSFASNVEADELMDAKMRESTRKAARSESTRAAAKKSTARVRKPPFRRKLSKAGLINDAKSLEHAKKAAPSAAFFKPALTQLRTEPPAGDNWLHEVKWDGYRILTTIAKGNVALWSRNALRWDEKIPDIMQAIESLGLDSAHLDGELIATDNQGRSDFNALQKTLSGEAQRPLVYVLFDIPYLEGYDLSRVALLDRKALLERMLGHGRQHLALSTHTRGNGEEAMQRAVAHRLEGIVSKRVESGYHAGRSGDWVKIKRLEGDEFAVVGYTPPKGSRSGFGSLLLAKPDPDRRDGWLFAGRVGTGFTDKTLAEAAKLVTAHASKKAPANLSGIDPLLRDARWVIPALVVEVNYRGMGGNNLLRQPSLKTLRMDKTPNDLRSTDRAPAKASRSRAAKKGPAKPPRAATVAGTGVVTITHPDRVVYPSDTITKQDVADYYRSIMQWLLPGLIERPLSVIRCPEGAEKPCFFQKHPIQGLHRVGTVRLKEEKGSQAVYMYAKDADSIMELVQFGTLEFHVWGTTIQSPDTADRVVFDLDPAPKVKWERVVAAARLLRKWLDQIGLQSFLRTTGGKGLHVVVPLNPACPWQQVKDFAHAIAATMATAYPDEFVDTASKAKRADKIFVDYLRNSRGATSIASYSLRARKGAPVATPLRWEELSKIERGDAFTLHTLPRRLARLRKDPWEGIGTVKQSLDTAIRQLNKHS